MPIQKQFTSHHQQKINPKPEDQFFQVLLKKQQFIFRFPSILIFVSASDEKVMIEVENIVLKANLQEKVFEQFIKLSSQYFRWQLQHSYLQAKTHKQMELNQRVTTRSGLKKIESSHKKAVEANHQNLAEVNVKAQFLEDRHSYISQIAKIEGEEIKLKKRYMTPRRVKMEEEVLVEDFQPFGNIASIKMDDSRVEKSKGTNSEQIQLSESSLKQQSNKSKRKTIKKSMNQMKKSWKNCCSILERRVTRNEEESEDNDEPDEIKPNKQRDYCKFWKILMAKQINKFKRQSKKKIRTQDQVKLEEDTLFKMPGDKKQKFLLSTEQKSRMDVQSRLDAFRRKEQSKFAKQANRERKPLTVQEALLSKKFIPAFIPRGPYFPEMMMSPLLPPPCYILPQLKQTEQIKLEEIPLTKEEHMEALALAQRIVEDMNALNDLNGQLKSKQEDMADK